MTALFVALRGALFAALFIALWVWLAAEVRRFDPPEGVALPGWLRVAGWALGAAGGALALACVAILVVRGRGTPAPFDPPREFVVFGPYRWVRNPMYVGAVVTLVGGGLVLGSPAVVLLGAVFWLLTHLLLLLSEEPDLKRRFGEPYARYRATVPRWLPRRPRP